MAIGEIMFRKTSNLFILIDKFPTTRTRIIVTTGLIIATIYTWLIHACDVRTTVGSCAAGWEPSTNMLIFLGAMAGVDVAQYLTRSLTPSQVVAEPMKAPEDEVVEVSTDISEISNTQKG